MEMKGSGGEGEERGGVWRGLEKKKNEIEGKTEGERERQTEKETNVKGRGRPVIHSLQSNVALGVRGRYENLV